MQWTHSGETYSRNVNRKIEFWGQFLKSYMYSWKEGNIQRPEAIMNVIKGHFIAYKM